MSRCRVEKRIWKDRLKSSDYTCLCYELEVADTPARGSELHEGRWFSGPVSSVIWNVDEACFHCRVEDEAPSIDRDYEYTHEFLVENAVSEGWRPCAPRGME